MEVVLLIYVICGVVTYLFTADTIQNDFSVVYTGTRFHLANIIAAIIMIALWPYMIYQRSK